MLLHILFTIIGVILGKDDIFSSKQMDKSFLLKKEK
jgi:hypothetical protein